MQQNSAGNLPGVSSSQKATVEVSVLTGRNIGWSVLRRGGLGQRCIPMSYSSVVGVLGLVLNHIIQFMRYFIDQELNSVTGTSQSISEGFSSAMGVL